MFNPALPLIDIHRHLDGNIRAETIWQLANQHGIKLPVSSIEQFLPYVQIQESEPDLMAFLQKLDWGVAVLKTLEDCKRIAFENVEDAYKAGLQYAELRFSPYYMAKTHNLTTADVVAAVIDGVALGMRTYKVKIKLIGILSRTYGVEACQHELDALLRHKQHLVAIDLAGDEVSFPGHLFVEHFKQVRDAGLHVTIHAGEASGPESVWQAINDLGAERIGHGVNSYLDDSLLTYIHHHGIALESCLTSNYQTGTIANLAEHPIKTFLARDIIVCLNTDDPAVENIEIKDEYNVAAQVLGFNNDEITKLQENALKASFLSTSEKQELLENFS